MQGLIDAEKEIAKLGDKRTKLSNQLKKLQEAAAKPDYVTKVPENVRTQNTEKVSQTESVIQQIKKMWTNLSWKCCRSQCSVRLVYFFFWFTKFVHMQCFFLLVVL